MEPEDTVDRYLELLDAHQWLLESSMCWTVVKCFGGRPELEAIASALSQAGDFEIQDLDVAEGPDEVAAEVIFFELFEDGYHLLSSDDHVNRDDILRALSDNARVWSLYSSPNRHRFVHAVDGEILVDWVNFRRWAEIGGVSPGSLDDEFEAVRAVLAGAPLNEAGMMAVMDLASGVRLDVHWLDDSQPAIVIHDRIP